MTSFSLPILTMTALVWKIMTRTIWMHVHAIIGVGRIWVPVLAIRITHLTVPGSIPIPISWWHDITWRKAPLSQMIWLKAATNRARECIWEHWVLCLLIRLPSSYPLPCHSCSKCIRGYAATKVCVHCSLGVLLMHWLPWGRWCLLSPIFKLILQTHAWHIIIYLYPFIQINQKMDSFILMDILK